MDPITMALIGAGVGGAKGMFIDRPREQRQRKLAAETIRYSPWTGMSPKNYEEADLLGSTMQGGMAGAGLGMNMEDFQSRKALRDAQLGWYQAGSNPYRSTSGPRSLGVDMDFNSGGEGSWETYRRKYLEG